MKKQFKGGRKPRTFFDRKVRPEGHTRTVSLGKIIPAEWAYIRVRVLEKRDDSIDIRITKLLEVSQNAS